MFRKVRITSLAAAEAVFWEEDIIPLAAAVGAT